MSHLLRNRYSLIDIIGRGTYGVVWNCKDKLADGAEKIIKESKFGDCEGFDPFENVFNLEVSVYKTLSKSSNSHYFPMLYEHFVLESPRKGYLVMEKLGESIRTVRRQNSNDRFSFDNTMKIALCVGKGLTFLHECGFLHLDIQENNVVFAIDQNSSVSCKIIDFGCSQSIYDEDGILKFEYPVMDFTHCAFSSLALNFMLPADQLDDWESFFYFVLAMFNRFDIYGGPEELIEGKTKLHLDPVGILNDEFLVKLWDSIVGQGYQKMFNPDEVLEVFSDLDVDFEKPLDCEHDGRYFFVE